MADIFVSYASEDRSFASKLADALSIHKYTVWWDRHIDGGKYFDRDIEDEILKARAVIVVWSVEGRESDWCRAEAAAALEVRKLLPISIQQARPPLRFMHLQTRDFSNWDGDVDSESFKLLLRDLGSLGVPVLAEVHQRLGVLERVARADDARKADLALEKLVDLARQLNADGLSVRVIERLVKTRAKRLLPDATKVAVRQDLSGLRITIETPSQGVVTVGPFSMVLDSPQLVPRKAE
jgi:hypothetical protein